MTTKEFPCFTCGKLIILLREGIIYEYKTYVGDKKDKNHVDVTHVYCDITCMNNNKHKRNTELCFYCCDESKMYASQNIISEEKLETISYIYRTICSTECGKTFYKENRKDTNGLRICTYCKKTDLNMSKCAKCKISNYCSRECQKLDWKNHKQICNI